MFPSRMSFHPPVVFTYAACCVMAMAAHAAARDARLDHLFQDYWEGRMRDYPTWATYLGDHRYDAFLTDHSDSVHAARLAAMQEFLTRLEAIPQDGFSPADSLNYRLFDRTLRHDIESAPFQFHLMPVTQQGGAPSEFAELPTFHPLRDAQDARNYIRRLRAFPVLVDQIIANMQMGLEQGLIPARITMEKVLPQYEALAAGDPTESILYQPAEKLPESISESERRELREEIRIAVRDDVLPAYRRIHDFIRDRYLGRCRTEPGIWALPDGDARYALLVRQYTTTDMSPEEIHELGRRELARTQSEMRDIIRRMGYVGSLADFMQSLRDNPGLYNTSAEELMQGFESICRRIDKRLPELFGHLPAQWYDLREIEAFRAPAAPAAYYYGAPDDGSRPAYFYVNTYRPESRPRYTMEALAYHEAVPGHHLQLTRQQELRDLPDFRRHGGFTSFVEGWALYSERLPKELGFYADPYSDFGRLTFEAWREVRLIVDTGIHRFKWSREEAIEFFRQNTALSEVDIISEVERYIAWPGQALAYKIGQLRILELRAEAERLLGDHFDIRRFHDALLEEGALPLDLLQVKMEAWIMAEREAASSDRGGSIGP